MSPEPAGRPPAHGLRYRVQSSPDLVTWTDVPVPAGATRTLDSSGLSRVVSFTDTPAPTEYAVHGRRFYRIFVNRW